VTLCHPTTKILPEPTSRQAHRFTFLDERSRKFTPDWEAAADVTVAILLTEAGRDPGDEQLHDLIGELSSQSDREMAVPEFAQPAVIGEFVHLPVRRLTLPQPNPRQRPARPAT
jgi:hypothetical protein